MKHQAHNAKLPIPKDAWDEMPCNMKNEEEQAAYLTGESGMACRR